MQQTWKDYLCLTECTRLCVKRSGPAALLVYTVRKGYGHLKKLIIRLSVLLLATGSLLLQSGIASADEKIDKPSNTPTFVGIMSSSHIEALEFKSEHLEIDGVRCGEHTMKWIALGQGIALLGLHRDEGLTK